MGRSRNLKEHMPNEGTLWNDRSKLSARWVLQSTVGPNEAGTLNTFDELVHYIEMSEASSTYIDHEQLKADNGWLDDD